MTGFLERLASVRKGFSEDVTSYDHARAAVMPDRLLPDRMCLVYFASGG